jgi:AraC family transcriptional activator of pyochelin receptor
MDVGAAFVGTRELTMHWETDGTALDAAPSAARVLRYHLSEGGVARLQVTSSLDVQAASVPRAGSGIAFRLVVSRTLIARLCALPDELWTGRDYHLPADLRAIVHAIRDSRSRAALDELHRSAKATELLCCTLARLRERTLVPLVADGALSEQDVARVVAARALIDDRWNQRLTVAAVARECGLSRAKLTRGFRELYECTVHEALATRRLAEARQILLTTDRPVALVGYASGYLSNAAFTRAFGRRYGASPSDYRAGRTLQPVSSA